MSHHKQILIKWNEKEAEIDEGIVELILLIWGNGIETSSSCQEIENGIAWIEFPFAENYLLFLNKVAEHPKKKSKLSESLYGRINGYGSDREWQYDIFPHNFGVREYASKTVIGENSFEAFYSIRFPTSDIKELIDILKRKLIVRPH